MDNKKAIDAFIQILKNADGPVMFNFENKREYMEFSMRVNGVKLSFKDENKQNFILFLNALKKANHFLKDIVDPIVASLIVSKK